MCERKCENAGWYPVLLHYSNWALCQKANLQLLHESFRTGPTKIARKRLSFLLRCVFNPASLCFSPVRERKAEVVAVLLKTSRLLPDCLELRHFPTRKSRVYSVVHDLKS